LRQEEQELIRSLLSGVFAKETLEETLSAARVIDMQDGGMGSIRFVQADGHLGRLLVEAEYVDSDAVLVSIAVNADQTGQPFEIDFWKVDFSPLKQYPNLSSI
jgi:hypothetical protein